jgi:hypothetical protein
MTGRVSVPLTALMAITGSRRCLRCARPLRDPVSIASGLGLLTADANKLAAALGC